MALYDCIFGRCSCTCKLVFWIYDLSIRLPSKTLIQELNGLYLICLSTVLRVLFVAETEEEAVLNWRQREFRR